MEDTQYKSELSKSWWRMMRTKLQTDDAGVRQFMRESQAKGKHVGGFSNPEVARAAARKSVLARKAKKDGTTV